VWYRVDLATDEGLVLMASALERGGGRAFEREREEDKRIGAII
jgi:hypothetical protein